MAILIHQHDDCGDIGNLLLDANGKGHLSVETTESAIGETHTTKDSTGTAS